MIGKCCPVCRGVREYADAECPACGESGELTQLVTLEEFRVTAGITAPPEPRLV